jgi:diguanylate cyclase (GGDEF)-like protein
LPTPKVGHHKPNNQILSVDRRKHPRKETLESLVASAFTSEDSELDKILRAFSDLSKTFKSGVVDPVAVDATLKRAALWAVQKSLLDREARSLAITDDLTGFFNRRGFLASVTQQLILAHRDNQSVLLFYFDVDHLKGINDSFGHRDGDLALVRTADALEETFRDSDVLARLGGDEFVVLAWEASIPHAQAILSRLEKHLEKVNAEEFCYKLSLSVGVARYDPPSPDLYWRTYGHRGSGHVQAQEPSPLRCFSNTRTKCIDLAPQFLTSDESRSYALPVLFRTTFSWVRAIFLYWLRRRTRRELPCCL